MHSKCTVLSCFRHDIFESWGHSLKGGKNGPFTHLYVILAEKKETHRRSIERGVFRLQHTYELPPTVHPHPPLDTTSKASRILTTY